MLYLSGYEVSYLDNVAFAAVSSLTHDGTFAEIEKLYQFCKSSLMRPALVYLWYFNVSMTVIVVHLGKDLKIIKLDEAIAVRLLNEPNCCFSMTVQYTCWHQR